MSKFNQINKMPLIRLKSFYLYFKLCLKYFIFYKIIARQSLCLILKLGEYFFKCKNCRTQLKTESILVTPLFYGMPIPSLFFMTMSKREKTSKFSFLLPSFQIRSIRNNIHSIQKERQKEMIVSFRPFLWTCDFFLIIVLSFLDTTAKEILLFFQEFA